MDDTDFIPPTKEGLQDILEMASSLFTLHALEINPKKTELIVINPSTDDRSVRFGGDIITARPAETAVRSLGVWFEANGSGAHTRMLVAREVSGI